jgi:hypothetical protein
VAIQGVAVRALPSISMRHSHIVCDGDHVAGGSSAAVPKAEMVML